MKIRQRPIGDEHPCFVIAEIGNNHNGSPETAAAMIEAAAKAGADAVKFQTFSPEDLVSPKVKADEYADWDVGGKFERWIDFLETFVLPRESYPALIQQAHDRNMSFISTPTSADSAAFLAKVGADALKIASMDLNYTPFLREVAQLGLPVIASTGMGTIEEIDQCVEILRKTHLALLHCVSNYPLDPKEANLSNITMLKDRYRLPVGFSDHSLGYELDVAAVALGARIIEKHFTLDQNSPTKAEHHFSTTPEEFARLVQAVRMTQEGLGSLDRLLGEKEKEHRLAYRRSLFLMRDVKALESIRPEDVRCVRPGTSLEPKFLDRVIGAKVKRPIKAFEPFSLDDLQ